MFKKIIWTILIVFCFCGCKRMLPKSSTLVVDFRQVEECCLELKLKPGVAASGCDISEGTFVEDIKTLNIRCLPGTFSKDTVYNIEMFDELNGMKRVGVRIIQQSKIN